MTRRRSHILRGSVGLQTAAILAVPANQRFGVYVPNDRTAGVIPNLETVLGRRLDIVQDYFPWSGSSAIPQPSSPLLTAVGTRDYMMTIQPSLGPYGATTSNCVQWQTLIAGGYDSQITTFANWINTNVSSGAIGGSLYLRFAHEMNGTNWYDWQVGQACGVTSAANYAAGFNHFVSVLKATTSHAQVIWCVNNDPATTITSYYPTGCDILGLDGYNFATNAATWVTDDTVFRTAYADIAACDLSKPIWICETGCPEPESSYVNGSTTYAADPTHSKASWVTALLNSTSYPRMTTLVYFDVANSRNWPVNSSTDSINAFNAAFSNSRSGPIAPISAPVYTTAPTIVGTPQVGSSLTCDPGQWSNKPYSYVYSWSRAGTAIAAAQNLTINTYVPVNADQANTLTCTVTVANTIGATSYTSPSTAAVGAYVAPINLVSNPGFESGLSGWTAQGASLALASSPTHTGLSSAQLTCTTAGTITLTGPYVSVSAGNVYNIGGWLQAGSMHRICFVQINWTTSSYGYISSNPVGYPSDVVGSWMQVSGQLSAPANATLGHVIIGIQAVAAGEIHYIDDISVASA